MATMIHRASRPAYIMPTALAAGLIVGLVVGSCTTGQRSSAKTIVDIATATCILLHGMVGSTADGGAGLSVQEICATEEELAPIVKHLLAARSYAASHPGGRVLDACEVPLAP